METSFELLKHEQIEKTLIVMVKLKSGPYDGKKLLVFKSCKMKQFEDGVSFNIDNDISIRSPFAEFEPTQEGWEQALVLACKI